MVQRASLGLRFAVVLLAAFGCGNDDGTSSGTTAVTSVLPSIQQDPTWYYPSYQYRRPLYLDSSNHTSLNNAIVRFQLNTASLVNAGKMRPDCNDIRLTYYNPVNGTQTPIDYLVLKENQTNSDLNGLVGTILPGTGVDNGCRKYSTLHEQYGMIYHNNRTYISYVGSDETHHRIFLTYYDHTTKDWLDTPVLVDTLYDNSSEENNEHRAPDLIVDGDGRFHIFYGCHGTAMLYKKSTYADDISGWATVWSSANSPIASATFPKAFYRNGKIWLFWRGSIGTTTNNARTLSLKVATKIGGSWNWSSKRDIIDAGGNGKVTYARGIAMGNETPTASIHVLWNWYDKDLVPAKSDPIEYHKVMYAKSPDGGISWVKADGTPYNATPFGNDPIVDADCVGVSTVTVGHWMQSADVALDSANNARCLYVYWHDSTTIELWFSKFLNGAWVHKKVNGSEADLARLYIDPTGGQYEIYGRRRGEKKYEVFRYVSTDEGTSWTSQRLTYQSWGHASYPIVARDPKAKIRAAWGVGNDYGGTNAHNLSLIHI